LNPEEKGQTTECRPTKFTGDCRLNTEYMHGGLQRSNRQATKFDNFITSTSSNRFSKFVHQELISDHYGFIWLLSFLLFFFLLGRHLQKKFKTPSFQIWLGWNLTRMFFT